MVELAPKQPLSIPMRLLWLRRKTEQIERPREKLAYVIAMILEEVSGRSDLQSDLVMNLKGRRFFCRKGTSDHWHVTFDYEPETTEFLSEQQGNVFMDVGAHIGRYTVLLASNFRKVVSAEPFGETFRILSRNVKSNYLRNIVLVNEALAEKEGHRELHITQEDLGSCSMILSSNRRVQVPVTTADCLLRRLAISPEEVSLVKIDVERAEQCVLKGAQHLLKRGNAKLLVEAWDLKYLKELKDLLVPFGYCMKCRLDGTNYLLEKT